MERGPRSRMVRTALLLGMITSALFSSLAPAHATSPPTFGTLRPDGGEFLAGGSTFDVFWTASHENDTVGYAWVNYSTDRGVSYRSPIAEGWYPYGGATVPWLVPYLNVSSARVRVCIQPTDASAMGCRESVANFTIDSARPYIVSTSPADGATNVPLNAPLYVQFSEEMQIASIAYSIVPSIVVIESWPALSLLILTPANGWAPCVVYTIQVSSGRDLAGNPLANGAPPSANPFSFSTTCSQGYTPVLIAPAGGEDWTGGSVHSIVWYQTDPTGGSVVWELSWTPGTNWIAIANGTAQPGMQTYDWTVPAVDTTSARVRVCATFGGNTSCDVSGAFTIDSTPPVLLAHYPVDGEQNVPVVSSVVVVFSEAMNRPMTERAFAITPTAFVLSMSWPDPTTLTIQLENLRPQTHYYWTFSCAATDASDSGNALANCQETHDFWTEGAGPLALVLDSPRGGESWTGGSLHPVLFTITNPFTTNLTFSVTARYASSRDSGSIGSMNMTVPGGSARGGRFDWVLPTIDATDAILNVTAVGVGGNLSDESAPFEIDSTPPSVFAFGPTGAQVPLDPVLFVVFSESMGVPAAGPISIAPQVSFTSSWNTVRDRLDAPLSGTAPCTTYTVQVGDSPGTAPLGDDSDPGNPLAPLVWSFTTVCAPTVDLLGPDGGEDWTGGSIHDVRWVADDADDTDLTVVLSYMFDGLPTFVTIDTFVNAIGPGTYSWTLPLLDSTAVRVRIQVTDAAGNAAEDLTATMFTIDSTPPTLLTSYPLDGAGGQKSTRDVWLVLTERVDRSSFEAAFTATPNPGGISFSWSVSNLGGDVVLIAHDPFRSNTNYAFTFGVTAKDDSDPGNPLASMIRVRFSTQPPPSVNPPVAKAVGKNQVLVGEAVTLDGRGSTGNITSYVWRIMDNQDRLVGVALGAVATYTFTQNGRYSVTLVVSDANGLSDDDTVEIAVTSNPNSDGLIIAGAMLAAALVASTETGRTFLFSWFLFPLYVRRKRNEALEHQTRGMILGYIMVHPGDTYTDIKRNLVLTNGTLTYHLKVMEREGLIRSQIRGPRKLFFPRGVRVPEDGGGLHEVQVRMFRAIDAVPGLSVKDIAGALGITSQHALYHLRSLAAQGYVRLERRGFALRCYAEPGKGPALHEDGDGENG